MQAQAVIAQLRSLCASVPEPFVFDADRNVATRPAAVVVPVVDYGDRATILLTKRTAHLHAHAGQVCFPGGMWEEGDATLLDTALRECEEELGIPRSAMTVIGEGRGRITGTGFHITPYVVHLKGPVTLHPDTFEVEAVFELPLELALRKASYQKLNTTHEGVRRSHDLLNYEGHCIWGATAGILRDLCRMLGGESWEDASC